ncbi:LuxR family transcriptional regulator [Burkholderia thailandensis]|nr:LuxR family transcriptional regulator [Burkholderia thailandensis]AWY62540.1 LuxR family transcriptional regulator [Burkholderia thailandensis]AWY66057.1 LuxR family transcriptional regulator [Burkholderia thailandensis]NOK41331.1 LuxR family transcriptional regulator [Burkholderia thailandensis]PHH35158.1 LuxR family transcriptional regulator [Burkholderia thailandensis]
MELDETVSTVMSANPISSVARANRGKRDMFIGTTANALVDGASSIVPS